MVNSSRFLNNWTPKGTAHVYRPVFQVESEFGVFRKPRCNLQGAGALCHQEPNDHQQEINFFSILGITGQFTYSIFNFSRESEFYGFRGAQGHLEGLGESKDQHGHGLGQGVDNFLIIYREYMINSLA